MRTKSRTRHVDSFAAYDKDGGDYKIDIYATEVNTASFGSHSPRWEETIREARFKGKGINRLDDETYEIFAWPENIVVRRQKDED